MFSTVSKKLYLCAAKTVDNMINVIERQRTGGVRYQEWPQGCQLCPAAPTLPVFCIMQKTIEGQAQTENVQGKPWTGQDNCQLPVCYFGTLVKWVDVDPDNHPVKDYIEALDQIVWRIDPCIYNGRLFRTIRDLRNDLESLDRNIERIMQKGGVE